MQLHSIRVNVSLPQLPVLTYTTESTMAGLPDHRYASSITFNETTNRAIIINNDSSSQLLIPYHSIIAMRTQ